MAIEQGLPFDPKSFLAKVGKGRSIGKYRKDLVLPGAADISSMGIFRPCIAHFRCGYGTARPGRIAEDPRENLVRVSQGFAI